MNRSTAFLCALAAGLGAGSCGGDPAGPGAITHLPRDLSSAEVRVIDGSNAFAFGLLREVRALSPDSPNTFLSPLSASMALGMAATGADGETWTQMRDVLGFQGMEESAVNEAYRDLIRLLLDLDPAVELGLGNAAWVDEVTLRPDFVDRLETYFGAEVDSLDFDDPGAADVMNAWVDAVTRGRISRLLDRADPDAVLYLINAIYFKADWVSRFDEDRTRSAPFVRADGSTATVPMMEGRVGYRTLNAGRHDLVQAVELPYGGDAFAAVAVLPPAGQSIPDFLVGIDETTWGAWIDAFDAAASAEDREGEGLLVRLPRFQLEWGATLNEPLQALGMTDAFIPYQADFTRMTDSRDDLYIFEVRQKTFVKVDEKGTEAAAATSVGVGPTSAPPSITFDRPFLFAIRERLTGALLFIGVIEDPTG